MKALKIVLATIAVIIAVFFSLGLIVPSYEYQSRVIVNASPEKCWAVFHDTASMKLWLDGFQSITLKKNEPMQPGSEYELIVTDDGHRMVMAEKIIDIHAPDKVTYEINNDVLKSEFSVSFVGTSSTTITSVYKITGNTLFWKSVLCLSRSYMTTAAQEQLDALKTVIEKQ